LRNVRFLSFFLKRLEPLSGHIQYGHSKGETSVSCSPLRRLVPPLLASLRKTLENPESLLETPKQEHRNVRTFSTPLTDSGKRECRVLLYISSEARTSESYQRKPTLEPGKSDGMISSAQECLNTRLFRLNTDSGKSACSVRLDEHPNAREDVSPIQTPERGDVCFLFTCLEARSSGFRSDYRRPKGESG